MKYQVAIYFDGPRSRWSKRLHDHEVIYLAEVPWLWLARMLGRGNCGNTGRCSYVITCNGKTIENANPAEVRASA